jgi:hypothetical protein
MYIGMIRRQILCCVLCMHLMIHYLNDYVFLIKWVSNKAKQNSSADHLTIKQNKTKQNELHVYATQYVMFNSMYFIIPVVSFFFDNLSSCDPMTRSYALSSKACLSCSFFCFASLSLGSILYCFVFAFVALMFVVALTMMNKNVDVVGWQLKWTVYFCIFWLGGGLLSFSFS